MGTETIKRITAERGETCTVDVEELHETLMQLPASIYVSLYQKMQAHICGISVYPAFAHPLNCSCNDDEKSAEDV